MKKKKKSQPTLTESVITTTSQLAKERGLDPAILEKEALEYGFGYLASGVCNVDLARYDQWISEQIRSSGADIEKPASRKTLSEVMNPGVLNANISRLSDQLTKDKADLEWHGKRLEETDDALEKKQIRVKMKRLSEKISRKEDHTSIAKDRLNHLLDIELGDSEIETPNTEENHDENDN